MKPAAIPLSERPTLTVDEFCAVVGIGRSLFYKAVAAGDLKLSKYGKRSFVKRDELKRFVDNLPRSGPSQPRPRKAKAAPAAAPPAGRATP
jgi:excisionase family DNA binding protein